MKGYEFEDKLELLGVLAGGFIVITAFGTLIGLPWTTTGNTTAALIQVIGIFATIGIGIALIAITYAGDVRGVLPGSQQGEEA